MAATAERHVFARRGLRVAALGRSYPNPLRASRVLGETRGPHV